MSFLHYAKTLCHLKLHFLIQFICKFYLNISGLVKYNPMRVSSYLPLPKELKAKREYLNIRNNDEKCFLWSILASLHPVQHENHPTRVLKYQEYEHELNMSGIKYPVVFTSKFFQKFYLNVSGLVIYDSMRASSYLPLSKELKVNRGCLIIQKNDEKSFLWFILASLHPVQHGNHPHRVSKHQEYEHELNTSGIKYPIDIKDIGKFEHQNNISVNVYGYEDKKVFPLCITTMTAARHHVNLLYIIADETSHYVLVKGLSRLVLKQCNNDNNKIYFCQFCLHGCTSEEVLKNHLGKCKLHGAPRIKLQEAGDKKDCDKVKFTKTEYQLRLPFVIYVDFKSVLCKQDSCEPSSWKSFTIQYQH